MRGKGKKTVKNKKWRGQQCAQVSAVNAIQQNTGESTLNGFQIARYKTFLCVTDRLLCSCLIRVQFRLKQLSQQKPPLPVFLPQDTTEEEAAAQTPLQHTCLLLHRNRCELRVSRLICSHLKITSDNQCKKKKSIQVDCKLKSNNTPEGVFTQVTALEIAVNCDD